MPDFSRLLVPDKPIYNPKMPTIEIKNLSKTRGLNRFDPRAFSPRISGSPCRQGYQPYGRRRRIRRFPRSQRGGQNDHPQITFGSDQPRPGFGPGIGAHSLGARKRISSQICFGDGTKKSTVVGLAGHGIFPIESTHLLCPQR